MNQKLKNPRLSRLRKEHEKTLTRIAELQARAKEEEKQIRDLENTDIVGLVRARGLSLEEFAALLHDLDDDPLPRADKRQQEVQDEAKDEATA